MDSNWIVENLKGALKSWNDGLMTIWTLLTTSPQAFKGGMLWSVMSNINGALQAIGLGLQVLFFTFGVVQNMTSFADLKRPETAVRIFIRFIIAKTLVTSGMELMSSIFKICVGIISTITKSLGGQGEALTLPDAIAAKIVQVDFLHSIPLWIVTLLSSLFITVCSFIIIVTVYGRFFRLYLYTALSPIPLSAFASEGTSRFATAFLKSYGGVCLEGAIMAIACIIYTAFATVPYVNPDESAVSMVWNYVLSIALNMIILLSVIRGSERVVREMMGLG